MLSLRGVTKRFGATLAVDDLSLEVSRGEVFGLLGPNGAGKTTTLAMAVGLLAPDAGAVVVAGEGAPGDPRVRRRLGVAPQAVALYEALSAEENLAFFARVQGLSGAALRERVEWALDFAQLADRRGARAGHLSGGMQRRLNLAAALLHRPELVLLDEPTAGVDPQSRNAILDRILELRREGLTVVYTTHYMEEAERLCDRVAIVDRGRVLALDTVDGLRRAHGGAPMLRVTRGGEVLRIETRDPAGELARVAAAGPVDDFAVERASLETVFLNLTGRHLREA